MAMLVLEMEEDRQRRNAGKPQKTYEVRGEIKITKFKEFMSSDTNKRRCTNRGDLHTPIYGETMYQQGRLMHSDLWRDYVPTGETYVLRSM